MIRHLPPYGRELRNARHVDDYVNPWVFAGSRAWQFAARRGPGRLVLPEGANPVDFDWTVLAGLDVVVRWPGASLRQIDALGAALVRAGASSVLVLDDLRYEGDRMVMLRPHRRYVPSRLP